MLIIYYAGLHGSIISIIGNTSLAMLARLPEFNSMRITPALSGHVNALRLDASRKRAVARVCRTFLMT